MRVMSPPASGGGSGAWGLVPWAQRGGHLHRQKLAALAPPLAPPACGRGSKDMKITTETGERHVLAVTVDNQAGVLAKITGLFTARGYNIESLTVADITADHAVSRITIVTSGPPAVIDQDRKSTRLNSSH